MVWAAQSTTQPSPERDGENQGHFFSLFIFFFFFQVQREKNDPSLEEAFSDEHFNEKWEEARDAASCQWELAAGVGCAMAHQPPSPSWKAPKEPQ